MPKKYMKAIDALQEAQKIAFAPFVFQTTVTLKKLGILDFIFDNEAKGGVTLVEIANKLEISEYGLGVLLEMAESSQIVSKEEDGSYELTKTGYFLNYNPMTQVNMNFTQDVCYQGLFYLEEAVREGKPAGLKALGNWKTIYEGLSQLEPKTQKSWFDFDHYYSDGIFDEALKIVFRNSPKLLFDIGGNTGKFAVQCCSHDAEVQVHIFDLPGQLKVALENLADAGYTSRVKGTEIDWLSPYPYIPKGADTIWMSQFLDCFSKEEILKILNITCQAMDAHAELIIIETFTDRQKFDNAKFTLEATSLYFTAMANGNSKMYKATDLLELVDRAGLVVTEDIALGDFHTLFVCKKR